jgi:hypothetical protein
MLQKGDWIMDEVGEGKGSEFGRGFAYPLALFIAHERMHVIDDPELMSWGLWFNAAGDHLFEFEPKAAPTNSLVERAGKLKDYVMQLRYGKATREHRDYAVAEAKAIMLELDLAHGVDAAEAAWR